MNKYLIFLTLIFSGFLFSQTKIDENITIDFPGKPETLENIAKKDTLDATFNTTLKAYYLNSKDDSYIAMRVAVLSDSELNEQLPHSTVELQKRYTQIIDEQLKSMSKKGLFLKDSKQIKWNNYLAYKLNFKGETSDEEIGESLILYLNGINYVFIYSKVGSYNLVNKEKFFKSIKINNPENLKQIVEPYNYWRALARIFFGLIFIFIIRRFIKKERKRNLIK
jgi:hypothetical protein